jgi:hypothetical protein
MATVKALIDEFCDRINQPREASYAGSTTPAARQFLSLFRRVGDELLKQPIGWPQLKRTYTFTTQTDVASYQLPGDFYRSLSGTQWGVTNQIPLYGALSDAQLAFQTYGVSVVGPYAGFQLNGAQNYIYATTPYTQRSAGYFQISPPGPDNTTENVIAYISRNYIWPTDWVTATLYGASAKVAGVNNIYFTAAGGTSGATRPSWTTGSSTDGTVTWSVYTEPYPITADTDICLFPDDIMVEGLRWAWYESKRQEFASIKAAWDSTVRTELGRANGNSVVNAGYDANLDNPWPVTPNGSWSI